MHDTNSRRGTPHHDKVKGLLKAGLFDMTPGGSVVARTEWKGAI